jgi:osmotically-inducible protein OsmY
LDYRDRPQAREWSENQMDRGEYYASRRRQSQPDWRQPGPFSGIGPVGYRRSDERVHEEICERLTQHAQIDARQIEVEVRDGEVTLTGEVENRRMKRMVEANVERIAGVIDVHNRLKMRDPSREKRMDNPFPGGPIPTGNAGYDES